MLILSIIKFDVFRKTEFIRSVSREFPAFVFVTVKIRNSSTHIDDTLVKRKIRGNGAENNTLFLPLKRDNSLIKFRIERRRGFLIKWKIVFIRYNASWCFCCTYTWYISCFFFSSPQKYCWLIRKLELSRGARVLFGRLGYVYWIHEFPYFGPTSIIKAFFVYLSNLIGVLPNYTNTKQIAFVLCYVRVRVVAV